MASHGQAQNLWELHEAGSSMDFFKRTVAALAKGKPEDRQPYVVMSGSYVDHVGKSGKVWERPGKYPSKVDLPMKNGHL